MDDAKTVLSARKRAEVKSVISLHFKSKRGDTFSVLSQSVPTSPRTLQQKKLTEGNLDLFKANQSEVNSKAVALDAISSINSRVVQERLKKFT